MKKLLLIFILAFAIHQLNALTVILNHTNVSCNGGCDGTATAVPSGGTPPYTYAWNPANAGNPITGLCIGNYTVTVTDGLAATASATCTITQPSSLNLTFSTTTINCNSGTGSITAIANGGVAPYAFLWMPGNITSPTITNVSAGSYTCTVTDINNCTLSGVINLTQPSAMNVGITPTNSTICAGAFISFAPNIIGGTPPYSNYNWSFPGGSPASSTAMNANTIYNVGGTYTITLTVFDANGCTASGTTTITVSALPTITITPNYPVICNGGSVTLSGGGALMYVWQPGGFTTQSITITPTVSQSYTLAGTDALGCTGTAVTTVTVDQLAFSSISYLPSTFCDSQSVTLSAVGITGGTPPFTYTSAPNNIYGPNSVYAGPGTYTMTITDMNGCVATNTTTLSPYPNTIALSLSAIEAGCSFSNGSSSVTATGGTAPYSYLWSNGNTTPTISNVSSSMYSITVTDNIGCPKQRSIYIGDSCNFVWPGDANDDAVADNLDILDIGIANGATGTTRANASLNWIGQPSNPWGQTLLSGTDYKWVDCNGDGLIDPTDTNAVIQNFGFTHNNRFGGIPVIDASLPDLIISMNQDSVAAGTPGALTVSLGSASLSASNIYGVAFTLNFDPTQIDASSFRMNENGTWMGIPNTNLIGVIMNNGTGTSSVQVAITRLNHINVNGFGPIATVGFMATNALNATGNTQNVNFSLSNVTVISANETTQQVNTINDSVMIVDSAIPLGVFLPGQVSQIFAYPNPFDQSVIISLPENFKEKNCEMVLTDIQGRIIRKQNYQTTNSIVIERGQMEAGIYICTIYADGAIIGNTKLSIK